MGEVSRQPHANTRNTPASRRAFPAPGPGFVPGCAFQNDTQEFPPLSPQVFKCSYNKIRVVTAQTLRGLWNLVRLHMDHNKIEFIHPQAFKGLTSLRLLHLDGNHLQLLHPGTFATFSFLDHFRLSNVRHLYLAENRLRSLPEGMLQNMPLLENVYLQGNPWACDCGMSWFLRWEAQAPGRTDRQPGASSPSTPPLLEKPLAPAFGGGSVFFVLLDSLG